MTWYFAAWKRFAVFDGRARRKELWMYLLWTLIVLAVVAFVASLLTNSTDVDWVVGLYELAVTIPTLAVGVRRLHDAGHSGWWLLIALIPLGLIWLTVLWAEAGDEGPNKYGPDPKGAAPTTSTVADAGWVPDPLGRHELRYWDSSSWTEHVLDAGVPGLDPIEKGTSHP